MFAGMSTGILGITFGIARPKTRRISIADGSQLDCSRSRISHSASSPSPITLSLLGTEARIWSAAVVNNWVIWRSTWISHSDVCDIVVRFICAVVLISASRDVHTITGGETDVVVGALNRGAGAAQRSSTARIIRASGRNIPRARTGIRRRIRQGGIASHFSFIISSRILPLLLDACVFIARTKIALPFIPGRDICVSKQKLA
jgi:hypothetical protein